MKMDCTCSQGFHEAPVKVLEVSENAIEKVTEILKDYKKIYMVADTTTYEIAGKKVEKMLRDAGMLSHVCIVDAPGLPTWENVGRALIEAGIDAPKYNINDFSDKPDYILAVGSGSINDTCRMVSYRLGIEYGIVGTAPSMDGYASVVAPLICGNRKIVYTCSIARHIIIDLNICANVLQYWIGNSHEKKQGSITAKRLQIWFWKLRLNAWKIPLTLRTEVLKLSAVP